MASRQPRLLEWCQENDFTITDVSGLTGYSVSYLSSIARGKREPGPRVKVTIARALGERVGDLFPVEREAAVA